MAGNKNSGGMRPTAPQNNPANVSGTGGAGQSGTQAAKYIPGLPYGQGQETMQQQMSAPMAGPTPVPSLPSVTPLTAPTERPNEPLTHGMDFGPGAGSEAMRGMPNMGPSLVDTIKHLTQFDPSGDAELIYRQLTDQGY